MDDALVGHTVDNRHSVVVSRTGLFCITGIYGRYHFFDNGAHQGTLACVVIATLFCLASAFFCLWRISQRFYLKYVSNVCVENQEARLFTFRPLLSNVKA